MRSRSQRLIVSGVVLVSGALPLAAQAAVSPPGEASSVAARAGDVASVSDTEARAASDGSSSRASVLRLLGQDVAGLGGTAKSDGDGSGKLLELGTTDVAQLQVAPWEVAAKATAEERTSRSRASLARLRLLDKVAELSVLNAESAASHKDGRSTGSARTDAAQLSLTELLDLVLLRSETDSESKASSYLVGLNGIEIGSDEQLGSICAVSAAPLIQVACLLAKGGTPPAEGAAATSSASAAVGDAGTAVISPVKAFSSLAASGRGVAAAPAAPPAAIKPAQASAPAGSAATVTAAAAAPAALPRTGVMAGVLGIAGAALVSAGLLARRLGRRPSAA